LDSRIRAFHCKYGGTDEEIEQLPLMKNHRDLEVGYNNNNNNNNNNLYCNGDTYHNSNLNIKLNGRGFYVFYKWQEHVQGM